MNYNERMKLLNLDSLYNRRLLFDLTMCFKIFKGFTNLTPNEFFTVSKSQRKHQYQIIYEHRNKKSSNAFSVRIAPYWNSLDSSIINCQSIERFKSEAIRWLRAKNTDENFF